MPLQIFSQLPSQFSSQGQASGSMDFFGLAARRLDYIDQRQRVLAQNIANADTPDFKPRDLQPFETYLNAAPAGMAQTSPLHLQGTAPSTSVVVQAAAARDPDGNSVDVEAQLTGVADDETSSALVGNLWKTTMGMYLTALGRNG